MIDQQAIISFLKTSIEPIGDVYSDEAYRAAVYLADGTYVPCVIFRNKNNISKFLLNRFSDLQDKKNFKDTNIVPSLFDGACTLQFFKVAKVEESSYALPVKLRDVLSSTGETGMGYTSFEGQTDDGKKYIFAGTSEFAFFHMPEGYNAKRLINVVPHKTNSGSVVYLEIPYYHCFIDFEMS